MLRVSGEATNTNCIVFGLTRPGLEPTIYQTRGEHANHSITDAVLVYEEYSIVCMVYLYRHVQFLATFCNIIINIIYIRRELVHVVYTK